MAEINWTLIQNLAEKPHRHIAAHYDPDGLPQLAESDALRNLIARVSRAAVAVALGHLANSNDVSIHEPVREFLTELAVELDIQAVEIEDGA